MHDALWAGVDLKIESAEFFLEQMGKALMPPERTPIKVALQSTGAIVETRWQRSFYAYLDAFLAMGRSAPEIVQACFGADQASKAMKAWFSGLPTGEQTRRKNFTVQFETAVGPFRALPLSNARNISLHRTGVAPAEVNITGRFGVSHVGTPVKHVPTAESRSIVAGNDPALQWALPCRQLLSNLPGLISQSMAGPCFPNVRLTSRKQRISSLRPAGSRSRFMAPTHSPPRHLSRAIIQQYRSVLESASLAPPSINLQLSAIRKLATEAAENDLLDRSVAQGIVSLKGVHQSGDRAGNWLHPDRDLLAQPKIETRP